MLFSLLTKELVHIELKICKFCDALSLFFLLIFVIHYLWYSFTFWCDCFMH